MKKYTLFLCLLLNFVSIQGQSVLDSPFIGERFLVYNGLINYKIWSVPEFLLHNAKQFNLSPEERLKIIHSKYDFYPSNYLFNEEAYWTKRVYKCLLLDSALNKDLFVLSSDLPVVTLSDFVIKHHRDPKLDLYSDSSFVHLINSTQLDTSFLKNVNCLEIKEDWYYNKTSNRMEVCVLGLGLGIKNGKKKNIKYWLYFPQIKNKISAEYPQSDILTKIKSRSYVPGETRVFGNDYGGMALDMEYQNDLDPMLSAQLLEDDLKLSLHGMPQKGSHDFVVATGEFSISGKIIEGKLEGRIEKKSNEGKLLQVFTYSGGLVNGSFEHNYFDGKPKQKGSFVDGLLQGEVLSYFNSGTVLSKKNYELGFLNGMQQQFYESGALKCKYYFVDQMLNGNFESFYADGSIKEKGTVSAGLLVGSWKYRVYIPEIIKKIVQRNIPFFNQKFLFVNEWTAEKLQNKYIEFGANYYLFNSDECFNKLCSNVEIIE